MAFSQRQFAIRSADISDCLLLEIVSLPYEDEPDRDDHDTKAALYAKLGVVLYYIVYNPQYWQRDRHQPFELYRLINGSYQL